MSWQPRKNSGIDTMSILRCGWYVCGTSLQTGPVSVTRLGLLSWEERGPFPVDRAQSVLNIKGETKLFFSPNTKKKQRYHDWFHIMFMFMFMCFFVLNRYRLTLKWVRGCRSPIHEQRDPS